MDNYFPLGPYAPTYRVVSTLATLVGKSYVQSSQNTHAYDMPIHTGTIIVSFCLGQRVYTFKVFSRKGLSSMTLSRFWLLFLLIDSLLFLVGSGVLVQGVGLVYNAGTCNAIQLLCITFYFVSKGAAYSLFLEKVYAVWPNRGSRVTSTAYKVGLVSLIGFLTIFIFFLIARETHLRDDGECVIGSSAPVTLAILLGDIGLNALLTGLFLVPLMRYPTLSPQIRQVRVRNFSASLICFFSSVANLAALAALHGHEVAWVCVATCSVDITINALVAFWVTRPPSQAEYSTGEVSTSIRWKHTCDMDADEAILTRFDGKETLHVDITTDERYVSKLDPGIELDSHSTDRSSTLGTKSLPAIMLHGPSPPKNGVVSFA